MPTLKIETPMKAAPRNCLRVTVKTFGPRTIKTTRASSAAAEVNRTPVPKRAGIVLTIKPMPIYVEPQTIHKVMSGTKILANGASVTPRTSGVV